MKKRHSAEQIVGLLRQADVDLGKGMMTVPDVCRRLGIFSLIAHAGTFSGVAEWEAAYEQIAVSLLPSEVGA